MEKKRILTGDWPTGRLHLGHYVGSLRNSCACTHKNEVLLHHRRPARADHQEQQRGYRAGGR